MNRRQYQNMTMVLKVKASGKGLAPR